MIHQCPDYIISVFDCTGELADRYNPKPIVEMELICDEVTMNYICKSLRHHYPNQLFEIKAYRVALESKKVESF